MRASAGIDRKVDAINSGYASCSPPLQNESAPSVSGKRAFLWLVGPAV